MPFVRSARTASPTPGQASPGSQPTSITSAPSAASRCASASISRQWQPRGMIDLGEDLDVVSAVVVARASARRKNSGSRRKSRGPRSTGTPAAALRPAPGRPRNSRAMMTRVGFGGTCNARAIHAGVISAATVIGSTSTE